MNLKKISERIDSLQKLIIANSRAVYNAVISEQGKCYLSKLEWSKQAPNADADAYHPLTITMVDAAESFQDIVSFLLDKPDLEFESLPAAKEHFKNQGDSVAIIGEDEITMATVLIAPVYIKQQENV